MYFIAYNLLANRDIHIHLMLYSLISGILLVKKICYNVFIFIKVTKV